MGRYADVIIDLSVEKLDRVFLYAIPESLKDTVDIGTRVKVPFGNGGRQLYGYVVGIKEKPDFDVERIKEIISVPDGVYMETRFVELAAWIKHNFGGTMNAALKTVLPVKARVRHIQRTYYSLNIEYERARDILIEYGKKRYVAKARLLSAVLENGIVEKSLLPKLNLTTAVAQGLVRSKILKAEVETDYRNPISNGIISGSSVGGEQAEEVKLNSAQRFVVDEIIKESERGNCRPALIYGVTGSGKTRVYIEIIKRVVERGRQAIVLIPEISLTFQTLMRFYKVFKDRVSVLNSRMSNGERYDQYLRAKNGDVSIIIGPRSALFAPFEDIGAVIIDEEHESSYKSSKTPRYDAREVARHICEKNNAQLVLGSATPSVESFYRASRGEYLLFRMDERANEAPLPAVDIVDLRKELRSGNRSIFSNRLRELMSSAFSGGHQVMLFLNRRGLAGFVSCRSCGSVIKCPHCDVSLSIHRDGKMHCHYCGYKTDTIRLCPECGSKYIGGFKAGTQSVERELCRIFPGIRTLRMDADTTAKKGEYEKILSSFANNEADVLIGTQMIVKGHDFGNVTLVGVLAADISLNVSDYRAAERTFDLLTQAAGRAGRGEHPGNVVIQTYRPEDYSIKTAAAQDYDAFYSEEIMYRELSGYPPITNMLLIIAAGKNREELETAMLLLKKTVDSCNMEKLSVIGPSDAAIARVNDLYRKVMYLKHSDREALTELKDVLEERIMKDYEYRNISVQFDFNPE